MIPKISNKNGETINPATEDLQRDLQTELQQLTQVKQPTGGGTEKVILDNGYNTAPDVTCRSVFIKPASSNTSNVLMAWDKKADADDLPLPATGFWVPIVNLSVLNFYSADVDAIVHLFYIM